MPPAKIGHRGAAVQAPENTLASFRRALELGCQGIELDIHRTRDGHLVVIHDPWLERTTSGRGLIRDVTLDQVRAADAGAWKGPAFAGERVPTLDEVVAVTAPTRTWLYIELKAGSIHYPGIENDLLQALDRLGCQDRVQVSSFDHVALRRLHEARPDLPLGMLYEGNLLDPVGMAGAIGASALHPSWHFVVPELVQKAHGAGLAVNVWTVNNPQIAMLMAACGVDGIMTDDPAIL